MPRNREPSDTKGRKEMERWRKRENGRVIGRADERNATRKGERMGASEWTDGREELGWSTGKLTEFLPHSGV